MYESPTSLEELCLNCVCDSITKCAEKESEYHEPVWWHMYHHRHPNSTNHIKFRDDLFLINKISERLLHKFVERESLKDSIMLLFSARNTRLKTVRLKKARVTKGSMKVLKDHHITDLECTDMHTISIGEMLECMSQWSRENMSVLCFERCSSIANELVQTTNFKNLRSLSLVYSELNQETLLMVCEDLRMLEKLDISGTKVLDLSPVTHLNQLSALIISDLYQLKNVIPTLEKLDLKHLDVSLISVKGERYEHFRPEELLTHPTCLMNLVSLDVSGWRDMVQTETLTEFIERRPKIRVLGMAITSGSLGCSTSSKLTIAGLDSEEELKLTLKKYADRSGYVQKALYHLFQLTNSFKAARPDVFDLVLPVMEANIYRFGIQMAATACLYNLSRGDLAKAIHPTALSRGVGLTLQAMQMYPEEFQLQKNCLLILCSDRILQEIKFDRFVCAKLVLDSLCAFHDINMNRMAVAICGILAAKVTTEETSELGANPQYMRKLLSMVQTRVANSMADITLKFTLSTLWNLTDESASTCTVFLDHGGAFLFLEVLRTFRNDSAIETKVLGLLNNISEVARLRQHLMFDPLMTELASLLSSENIDVSYFAAGIVAHLASDGDQRWGVCIHTRQEMLDRLLKVITEWRDPEGEMVAYRSFRPFYPLLKVDMDHQIQLWAVWAIHHVCTKNPERYCPMMQEENGHLLLRDLVTAVNTNPKIVELCSKVLDTLESRNT